VSREPEFIAKLPPERMEAEQESLTAVQTGLSVGDKVMSWWDDPSGAVSELFCVHQLPQSAVCECFFLCLDTTGRKLLSSATVKIHNIIL